MANPFRPVKLRGGTLLQAGIPTRPVEDSEDPRGLLLRGVVTATYLIDDPGHPFADSDMHTPMATYCDVLAYGRVGGVRFLPKVLVSCDLGAMHRGRVRKLRATTKDVTGNALQEKTNPWDMDGDHVLVGFMEGNLSQPVILRGIPHPKTDVGQEQEALAGHRLRLKVADGDPDFWKHRGAFYGISDDGDFVADLTQAYDGDLEADGKQPTAPEDGTAGNFEFKAQKNAEFRALVDSGKSFWVKAAEIAMGVENPSDWMALASLVKTEIQKVVDKFNGHGHTTTATVGPSAVPGLLTAPIYPALSGPPTAVMPAASDVKSATVKSE